MAHEKQRLILLYDGTWNDPQDRTNVYRLSRNIEDYDGDVCQRFFYDPGVGTSEFSQLRGGLFGTGLSKNLLEGYDWLARCYTKGDEIWIFGFSRGAFTARSLVGMIRKCGLLHIATPDLLAEAEKLYRDKHSSPDSENCLLFRTQYSRIVNIHLIGVWDTVGALGVPGTMISERDLYSWHDTQLSKIVERAYQAVALDEHRAAYDAVLWTAENGEKKAEQIDVEQRWFIGAHANVGGGYGDDPLADLSLEWMQKKASAAGLKLTPYKAPSNAYKSEPRDSFKEFLKGGYSIFRKLFHSGDSRHHRYFNKNQMDDLAINATIDPSVWARWKSVSTYRPQTLVAAGLTPPEKINQ
ncbi:MAG: DUF2235 domain-containing protein [Sulfuricurvum sp.]|nr:DUF2235 domain-containing protein [Sulfuricurvum sp.]